MNRDDIIRLAREADCLDPQHYGSAWADKLERFAALVSAAEREACRDIAAQYASCEGIAQKIEQEIRGRGER